MESFQSHLHKSGKTAVVVQMPTKDGGVVQAQHFFETADEARQFVEASRAEQKKKRQAEIDENKRQLDENKGVDRKTLPVEEWLKEDQPTVETMLDDMGKLTRTWSDVDVKALHLLIPTGKAPQSATAEDEERWKLRVKTALRQTGKNIVKAAGVVAGIPTPAELVKNLVPTEWFKDAAAALKMRGGEITAAVAELSTLVFGSPAELVWNAAVVMHNAQVKRLWRAKFYYLASHTPFDAPEDVSFAEEDRRLARAAKREGPRKLKEEKQFKVVSQDAEAAIQAINTRGAVKPFDFPVVVLPEMPQVEEQKKS